MIILFNYCKKWKETAIMNFDFWIFPPLLFCLTILDLFSHDILIFILIFETNHCNYFFSGKSLIRKLQFLTETFLVVSGSNLLSFYSLKIEKRFSTILVKHAMVKLVTFCKRFSSLYAMKKTFKNKIFFFTKPNIKLP